jgi:hypothetical protein
MKTRTGRQPASYHPSESEIREKARELYTRSGWVGGRDLDNWLEAEAFLTHDPLAHPGPEPKHDDLLPRYGGRPPRPG